MEPTTRIFALLGAIGALLGGILGEFLIPRPAPQHAAIALVIEVVVAGITDRHTETWLDNEGLKLAVLATPPSSTGKA